MIPIKLKVRNFMPYRDNVPALSFEGIHTACISGDNGNGKSALLDAMTWALWGRARAKSDDDLIHLGQAEMEVEFDFAVGEQTYRIIRKRSKPRGRSRAGQTILELQVATGDGFQSITGDSITQTQQKIINVLHIDYALLTARTSSRGKLMRSPGSPHHSASRCWSISWSFPFMTNLKRRLRSWPGSREWKSHSLRAPSRTSIAN